MKKRLFLVAIVAVFIPLLMCNSALKAQEVALEECYGGIEVTNLAYYDTAMGAYVAVPVRCLPWWWDPIFLPYGWTFLTPAIVPVAWIDDCFFSGGYISFSHSRIRIVNARFEHFRGHIHGLRGDFHRHWGNQFERARRGAHEKYGHDLKKPPPNFRHVGHSGSKAGSPGRTTGPPPGKFGPSVPPKEAPSAHKPPPPKAGMATGKSGPLPPVKSGSPPAVQKAPPPPKAGGSGPGMGIGGQAKPQAGIARPQGAPARVAAPPKPCPPPAKAAPAKAAPQKKQPGQK